MAGVGSNSNLVAQSTGVAADGNLVLNAGVTVDLSRPCLVHQGNTILNPPVHDTLQDKNVNGALDCQSTRVDSMLAALDFGDDMDRGNYPPPPLRIMPDSNEDLRQQVDMFEQEHAVMNANTNEDYIIANETQIDQIGEMAAREYKLGDVGKKKQLQADYNDKHLQQKGIFEANLDKLIDGKPSFGKKKFIQ